MRTTIKFSRENDLVKIPKRRFEDAGCDLYVDPVWLEEQPEQAVMIYPNTTVMIPTGLRSVIDPAFYAQIEERGSTGTIGMKKGSGVIDSGFRSVWSVVLTNSGRKPIILTTKENYEKLIDEAVNKIKEASPEAEVDREYVKSLNTFYPAEKGIAQFVLLPVPQVEIQEVTVDEILATPSERGEGKLGSTDKI